MAIVFSFIIFLVIFLLLVEFFTVLFTSTGLNYEKARFQIISLLTGSGYTTKESELITRHIVRRKIASWVMILGYVGSFTFMSLLVNIISQQLLSKNIVILILSIASIILLLRNKWLIKLVDNIFEKIIVQRLHFNLDISSRILARNKNFGLYNLVLDEDSFLIGKSLKDSELKETYQIQVLNINKGDKVINFPGSKYIFEEHDNITIYGNIKSINQLFRE